jgi:hypothetical protein
VQTGQAGTNTTRSTWCWARRRPIWWPGSNSSCGLSVKPNASAEVVSTESRVFPLGPHLPGQL